MGDGSGLCRLALVASRSTAERVTRTAAGKRARLARRSCGQWETPKRRNRPDWLAVIDGGKGVARGEALGEVTGTSLDKGVELDALAKLPKDERKGLVVRAS
jgi:hypothetical protein